MAYKSGRVITNIAFVDTEGQEHQLSDISMVLDNYGEEVITLDFVDGRIAKIITQSVEVKYGDKEGRYR